MEKKIYIINGDNEDKIIREFTKNYGLPEVTSSLAIYFYKDSKVYELMFENSKCYFKVDDKRNLNKDDRLHLEDNKSECLKIENKNIKFFLRFLSDNINNEPFIGEEVIKINFKVSEKKSIQIYKNTPIGTMLVVRGDNVQKILGNTHYGIELTREDMITKFDIAVKKDILFDQYGILNSKIVEYSDSYGIDLKLQGKNTLKGMLAVKSNDYSKYDQVFYSIFECNLKDSQNIDFSPYFKPLSIIIPSFNSERTILKTLLSIESQAIDRKLKKMLDVIVIDDGSTLSITQLIKKDQFSFNLRIIRLEQNEGLSNARNLGVDLSKYPHILFLDSDILLAKNYISTHSAFLQMFSNCLFVSMKKNIEIDNFLIEEEKISKGLVPPVEYDDKRIVREFEGGSFWSELVTHKTSVEALSESNLFKKLGYGRHISGYDLSSVVIGHNMSLNKDTHQSVGGFSNEFKGWGMEDTYFGTKVIAKGCFVVPLIGTGVYHINHLPRSGSSENQKEELEMNLNTYKNLIEKEYE